MLCDYLQEFQYGSYDKNPSLAYDDGLQGLVVEW